MEDEKVLPEPEKPWHTLTVDEAASFWETEPATGLTADEAEARRSRYGENRLAESRPRPAWLKFLDQFKSFLVIVLVFAAVVAWGIGDLKDAVVILVVVTFNACLGFYQEHRAEQTLSALKEMLVPTSRVRRDGHVLEVAAASLVPGDIVLLEAGDQVPADGRVVAAHALEVQEAALTGESQAVGKFAQPFEDAGLALGERCNMLYMNTVVTRGRGELLVVATGMKTQMGDIAAMIARAPEGETPLQRQLDLLGKRLAAIAGVVVLVIFGLTLLRGAPWAEAAMTAVALAVAAVPEGLPAVVTVTLAIGMWRMARKRAILKKLASVETLGSTTVICTDKTGTLTLNQMTARAGWYAGRRFSVTGQGYSPEGAISVEGSPDLSPLLLPMALCTESRVRDGQLIGDPTEGALYVLAQKGGLDPMEALARHPRIAEIPFDSAHKFMATFHREDVRVVMYVKGASDILLAHAGRVQGPDGPEPLDEAARRPIHEENDALADQALRVLALARREIPEAEFAAGGDLWQWVGDWTFLGLVGLMDPPRPEAADAVTSCREAGIQVKMITGDHKKTAAAVAGELGLSGEVVSGADLDAMSAEELARRINAIGVFARVSPQHKVKIVSALKADGHVTAMTGDGVNDAPALKAADIGVAMGITGTAVTREAATLVLTDDNFATIVHAVEEGRVIYDNIVKFVRFQLSTNIAAILTVLAATLLAMPVPFTAIQLLWINIIMDGPPAMSLGIEPAQPGLMRRPPRTPGAEILSGPRLFRLVVYGLTMTIGTLAVFAHGLSRGNDAYAVTLAFTTFVLYQFFNVFNARAEHGSAFNEHFFGNGKLWLALAGVLLLQTVVVHWPPAQSIFGTTALSPADWGLSALTASSVLLLDEARKLLQRVWKYLRAPRTA
ncbi:cation-translocating P-type ATPase [Desulfococcus sp.]|uniref:cation-translocating P-type ATPase n=1 Tax=Desulfococcus sp. TaxID=2025834 RepID=UPI003593A7BB